MSAIELGISEIMILGERDDSLNLCIMLEGTVVNDEFKEYCGVQPSVV